MTKQEQKQYIKSNWNISSGAKIAEMVRRYFVNQPDIFETAQEVFKTDKNGKKQI